MAETHNKVQETPFRSRGSRWPAMRSKLNVPVRLINAFQVIVIDEASIPSRVFAIGSTFKRTTMDQIMKEQRRKMQQHLNR